MATCSDSPDPAVARGGIVLGGASQQTLLAPTHTKGPCVGSEAVLDNFHLPLSIKIQVPVAQELNVMPQETQRPDTSTDSAIRV